MGQLHGQRLLQVCRHYTSDQACLLTNHRWPVIVVIIIAALIVGSVVMCIARCICCGAECACCCFRCCASCCGGGRRGHKRVKSDPTPTYPTPYGAPPVNPYPTNPYPTNPYPTNPYAQAHAAAPPAPPIDARPINQQYRSNAMPTFNPAVNPLFERPQIATFDSTRAVVNDDSLPAMPTWKDGRDVHVQVEERPIPQKQGDMELDRLDRNGSVTSGTKAGLAAAAVPGARPSPAPVRSPISPIEGYGVLPDYPDSVVSTVVPVNHQGVYNQDSYGRQYGQQNEHRGGPPAQNPTLVYGAGAGYAQQQQYGRHSPGQHQAYDSRDQIDQYNQQVPYGQRDYYDEPQQPQLQYRNPSPPNANPYHNNYNANPSYDNFAPAPVQQQQQRSHTPGWPASESTALGSAYPGQKSYTPVAGSVGQQQPYRAFTPVAQGQQYSGVQRKPVDGAYREM
jgi:hypothetical protein